MNSCQEKAIIAIKTWFDKAEDWQKDLFTLVWNGATDKDQIVGREEKLILQEYFKEKHHLSANTEFPKNIITSDSQKAYVLLNQISNVSGVGALASKTALSFADGLTVVYGENGCGKSSYVRILKALENPEFSESILGNVFDSTPSDPKATISFSINGEPREVSWSKRSKKKYPIQIYDSHIARQFVDKENEVIYEPKLLDVVSFLASIYDELSKIFEVRQKEVVTQFEKVPDDIRKSTVFQEFNSLSSEMSLNRFFQQHKWNPEQETELKAIETSLTENNPLKSAKEKRAQKSTILTHKNEILRLLKLVSKAECDSYLKKRNEQVEKKKIADSLIEKSQSSSLLEGFGSDAWKALWEAACQYIGSIQDTSGVPFDQIHRCALCQQEISPNTEERLHAFKEFVESKAITESETAYQQFKKAVETLQNEIENAINIPTIKNTLQGSGISDDITDLILSQYQAILERCEWLLSYNTDCEKTIPEVKDETELEKQFSGIIQTIDQEIVALEATAENRDAQEKRLNQLKSIKYVTTFIGEKQQQILLSTIISKCKTNALTTLKKELSLLLITETYITRFKEEMHTLDPEGRIKVELISSSPKKGKAYHQVILKGASTGGHKNGEVLSEGEFRVVSLAAFLADMTAWNLLMPFVFDDPITSLDHKFEKRVAERIVELSTDRQVIVFTHRLAFAELLDESYKQYQIASAKEPSMAKTKITHLELRSYPLGQPMAPNYLKNTTMEAALNEIISTDLHHAKTALEKSDFTTYEAQLRSTCTSFRNVIEHGIEVDLLSGIVSRFSRNVSTLKLPRLYAISPNDISLFDRMMTKYSFYNHSHSTEAPISLPPIEDVEKDICDMLEWAKSFRKRCNEKQKEAQGK